MMISMLIRQYAIIVPKRKIFCLVWEGICPHLLLWFYNSTCKSDPIRLKEARAAEQIGNTKPPCAIVGTERSFHTCSVLLVTLNLPLQFPAHKLGVEPVCLGIEIARKKLFDQHRTVEDRRKLAGQLCGDQLTAVFAGPREQWYEWS